MFFVNKKYILLVCPVYEPYRSGGAQSFPLIVKALSENYKLIILTEFHAKCPLIKFDNNRIFLRILPLRDNYGKKSFLYSLFSFLGAYLLIYFISIISKIFGVKIFHFTRYCNLIITPLIIILKFLNTKIIYDCRTEVNKSQYKQFSFVFKFCDFILANSEAAYNSLLKYAPKDLPIKFIVNPLKIKDIKFPKQILIKDKLIKENKYIICIGTISQRKASIAIAKAYIKAVSEFDKFKNKKNKSIPNLLFIGRNDIGKDFDEIIKKHNNISYLGTVSHQNSLILNYLSFGSINASFSEGIPRSCLEALYLNKPVLLPSCVPEFVKYCPDICVNVETNKSFVKLVKLIQEMILNKKFVIDKNNLYPINKHKYDFFKSDILRFYSNLDTSR